jgi:putative membrane protein
MAQEQSVEEPPVDTPQPSGDIRRTSMAAERTWLAWWRTALAATAGSLAIGRLAPQLLDVTTWPYIALGIGYAVLAIALLLTGAYRQRSLERAATEETHEPLHFFLVAFFTVGGVMLVLTTIVLVVAQS